MQKIITDKKKIEALLAHGVEEIVIREHFKEALLSGRRLRVKLGIDPTAPDLHLGHAVPLRKLRELQDLGHIAVLIIGDFTAKIGDPSGRSIERPPLTDKDVQKNKERYLEQAGKIIDIGHAEILHNSEWFGKEGVHEVIELARAGSLQQVLHRADFKKRMDSGHDITFLELFYPLFQGYDSVKVRADVELGGTDQKFNLLMGRRVERHFGLPEQDALMVPLLEGTDGTKKMSKSSGNYIALEAPPEEMFGKIMSLEDGLISKYFDLCTDLDKDGIQKALSRGPREAKFELAKTIVTMYHSKAAGEKAGKEFNEVFRGKKKPADIQLIKIKRAELPLVELLVKTELAPSKSEARRLILQGGVRVNDVKKTDPNESVNISSEILVQVGPRRFLRVRA